jgi:hypothetical protein
MKVFIRSSALSNPKPQVVAYYEDNADVPETAHGPGMTILHVPPNAVLYESMPDSSMPDPMPKLVPNWRELAGKSIAAGEAQRRIKAALPPEEQIATLRELIGFIIDYGLDVSTWPTEAKTRKAKIYDLWNYIDAIKQHAQSFTSAPADPMNDKIWPPKIKKQ